MYKGDFPSVNPSVDLGQGATQGFESLFPCLLSVNSRFIKLLGWTKAIQLSRCLRAKEHVIWNNALGSFRNGHSLADKCFGNSESKRPQTTFSFSLLSKAHPSFLQRAPISLQAKPLLSNTAF